MIHVFSMLNKAIKDKVHPKSTSNVIFFTSIISQKAVMQVLCIIDCPAEPHLLLVLMNVKKIWAKCRSHTYMKTHVSLVKANLVYGPGKLGRW